MGMQSMERLFPADLLRLILSEDWLSTYAHEK